MAAKETLGEMLLHLYSVIFIYHILGGEIKVRLSPGYKNYFDQIKAKLGELTHTTVPLIAGGIPSLEEVKTFLGTRFHELKSQLSTAESFDDVIALIKKKCTISDITCLETIVNHFNIENIRHHITTYKSAVDEICEKIKHRVLENEKVITHQDRYESITFVLGWQQTDDFTLKDINTLLQKLFGNMAKIILSKYGLIRKLIKNKIILVSLIKSLVVCIVNAMF